MAQRPHIPYPGFCGPGYNCQPEQAAQGIDRIINGMIQPNEVGTTQDQQATMRSRPGYTSYCSPGLGVGRGMFVCNMTIGASVIADQLCGCAGSKFFTVTAGVSTVRGDIGSGDFQCIVFPNVQATQVAILNTSSQELYVWNGTTVSLVTIPEAFYSMSYLNGFAYAVAGGNRIYQSGLNDFTSWNASEVGVRLDAQDFVQTLFAADANIWAFGQQTSSPFSIGTDGAGFALSLMDYATVRNGINAPFSVCSADVPGDTVTVMMAKSTRGFGQAMVVRPGKFDRISTYAIEIKMQNPLDNTYGIIGSSFQMQGHSLYSLTGFLNAGQIVYDFTAAAQLGKPCWYEWGSGANVSATGEMPSWYASKGVPTYSGVGTGEVYGMRKSDGRIVKMDATVRTDEGTTFAVRRVGPILYNLGSRTAINEFRTNQQVGNGLGSEPVGMKISYDGGLTWVSAIDGSNSYGYSTPESDGMVRWRNLGQADQRGMAVDVLWDTGGLVTVNGGSLQIRQDAP